MAPVAADFGHHSDSHLERLVLVANRLPIRAERVGKKLWRLEERDGGGLVSALRGSLPSFPFTLYLMWVHSKPPSMIVLYSSHLVSTIADPSLDLAFFLACLLAVI